MRLYLDNVAAIYLIEEVAGYCGLVRKRLANSETAPVVSEMTRLNVVSRRPERGRCTPQ